LGCAGLLTLLLAGAFLAVWTVPPAESEFTLRIAGDPGTELVGTYTVDRYTGYPDRFDVHGPIPYEVTLSGTALYARVARQPQSRGALTLTLLRGGRPVEQASTVEPDGVVEVSTRRPERN
jgi:hypothetical protein